MKKDFLKNLKVGDQALPDEVVDAILAENTRDIEAAKKPFADYDTIKTQLEKARDTIAGLENQDIDGARKAAKDWEEKYNQAVKDHAEKVAGMEFDRTLEAAITGAKGRNAKAIKANLDLDALKASKNQAADIQTALEGLKKSDAYLFGSGEVPPPYSAGTGTGGIGGSVDGVTAAFAKLNPGLKI